MYDDSVRVRGTTGDDIYMDCLLTWSLFDKAGLISWFSMLFDFRKCMYCCWSISVGSSLLIKRDSVVVMI